MNNTCGDFWQMVWEQKSAAIVMLTQLEEDGTVRLLFHTHRHTHKWKLYLLTLFPAEWSRTQISVKFHSQILYMYVPVGWRRRGGVSCGMCVFCKFEVDCAIWVRCCQAPHLYVECEIEDYSFVVRLAGCCTTLFVSIDGPIYQFSFLTQFSLLVCLFVFRNSVCSTGPVRRDRPRCMAASRSRCTLTNKHCLITQSGSSRSPW